MARPAAYQSIYQQLFHVEPPVSVSWETSQINILSQVHGTGGKRTMKTDIPALYKKLG